MEAAVAMAAEVASVIRGGINPSSDLSILPNAGKYIIIFLLLLYLAESCFKCLGKAFYGVVTINETLDFSIQNMLFMQNALK